MNQKTIVLLGIAILSMAILIWGQRDAGSTNESKLLLASLKENLNHLEKVEIKTATESISLVRLDSGWGVSEKHLYSADLSQLSELLDELSKAKLVEKKTSRPENFAILEVRNIDVKGSKASLVSGYASDYSFSVLIGKSAQGRDGHFVRRPDESQVWLTDKSFELGESTLSWLDPVIVNIDSEKIVKVDQFDASGVVKISVERIADEENLVLRNLPEGRRLRYPSVANTLARSLVNVRLIDVAPHAPEKWHSSSRSEYSLDDGGKITVRAVELAEKKWLHVSSLELTEIENVGQLDKWDFQVADYVYDDFVKNLDDLLDKEPSAVLDKEPSAVLSKEPSAVLDKEPSAVLDKEPSAVLSKEPSAVLDKEPSAVL
ncbi:MAG: DUF4340 domain-containing protein, partial [Gammaproteobacteria bacterium]|nr:DUF4340 domain-containing protein [Gammaproteobacteria bacterium]